jgi:hypothetical protein
MISTHMILPKQELYQQINYVTEDIIEAVHSQCESALYVV